MGGARKGSKKKKGNRKKPPSRPPPPPPSASSSAEVTTATAAARDGQTSSSSSPDDEEVDSLLSDLRTKCRSLLSSLSGVAPDGAPFAIESHPLFALRASVEELTGRLIEAQRRSRERRGGDKEEESKEQIGSDVVDRGSGGEAATTDDDGQNRSGGRYDPTVRESFDAWLNECGVGLTSNDFPLELRESSFGYGLFATREIGYDETVLRIPLSVAVCPYWRHRLEEETSSASDADDDGQGPVCRRPPPFDPNRRSSSSSSDDPYKPLCLVTHIVNEKWKGKRSKIAPYLDALPSSYDTPLFWSYDETNDSLLDVTDHRKRCVAQRALTVWEYLTMRDAIVERHAEARKEEEEEEDLIPVDEFTYELYRWATGTAHTRQNLLPYLVTNDSEGEEGEVVQDAYGLVPLWDMLNHEDSDRACRSEVVFVEEDEEDRRRDDSDDGEEQEKEEASSREERRRRRKEAVLVCRTPPYQSKGAEDGNADGGAEAAPLPTKPCCFQKGEEVTMHYGDRSNAQLLFHSGFVNGELLLSTDETATSGKQGCINRNRNDRALLRLALPPAAHDDGLDRVREMIAAKFGFKAYVDQGCRHDGMVCAEISANVAREFRDGGESNDNNGAERATRKRDPNARDANAVVMTEISVSPSDVRPTMDLARALILCVADREELNDVLRNMDRYTVTTEDDDKGGKDRFPTLTEKHARLASTLVNAKNEAHEAKVTRFRRQRGSGSNDARDGSNADRLALELACCDNVTLNAWLEAFKSQVTSAATQN